MLITRPQHRLGSQQRGFFPFATITIVLTVLSVAILQSIHDWQFEAFSDWLFIPASFVSAIQQSVWQQLSLTPLTSTLFHANWLHVIGNLIFLLLFAIKLERWIKPFWLIVSFAICGSLSNLIILLSEPESLAPVIGVSGSVSSLMGLLFGLAPMARVGVILPLGIYLQPIRMPIISLVGAWLLLQVGYYLSMATVTEVAWWTHIGGFLFGCTLALTMRLLGFRASKSRF